VVYGFKSTIGVECDFFIKGESLVFIGDNTTWSVPRQPDLYRRRRSAAAGILSRIRKWFWRAPGH
jgi:hypothetical protein